MRRALVLALALLPAGAPGPPPVAFPRDHDTGVAFPRDHDAGVAFPRDHGAHRDAPVEWWYYTGHLSGKNGRKYGFQLTFFRVRDVHLAHFAWTDVSAGRFEYDEKTHLGVPGIASAAEGRLDVSNEDWSARAGADGVHRLSAEGKAGRLELRLAPSKRPVLHGEGGLSRKGAGAQEFSRYVSITRLTAKGSIANGSRTEPLTGTAWFDHEWGAGVLPAGAAGWDWFALQLDDASELMLYRMRGRDGAATPFSSGTFVPARGPAVPVAWTGVRLTETASWTSPRSRARYPAAWRIIVAPLSLDVTVAPRVAAQELDTAASTGVTYWEGACSVRGTRAGRPVAGNAYVELTGYAGRDVPGLAGITAPAAPSVWASAATSSCRSGASRPSGKSNSRSSGFDTRTETGP